MRGHVVVVVVVVVLVVVVVGTRGLFLFSRRGWMVGSCQEFFQGGGALFLFLLALFLSSTTVSTDAQPSPVAGAVDQSVGIDGINVTAAASNAAVTRMMMMMLLSAVVVIVAAAVVAIGSAQELILHAPKGPKGQTTLHR